MQPGGLRLHSMIIPCVLPKPNSITSPKITFSQRLKLVPWRHTISPPKGATPTKVLWGQTCQSNELARWSSSKGCSSCWRICILCIGTSLVEQNSTLSGEIPVHHMTWTYMQDLIWQDLYRANNIFAYIQDHTCIIFLLKVWSITKLIYMVLWLHFTS